MFTCSIACTKRMAKEVSLFKRYGVDFFTKETSSKFVRKIWIRRRTPYLFNVTYFVFHTEFCCSFSLFTHFKLIQFQLHLIMRSVKVETSSMSQFPIPLRVLLARTIVCILNYFYLGTFFITTQHRIKNSVSTFCIDLDLAFTLFKIRVKDPIPKNLRLRVFMWGL